MEKYEPLDDDGQQNVIHNVSGRENAADEKNEDCKLTITTTLM
jgi:hypothetical protein